MKKLGLIAFILGIVVINFSFSTNTEKIGVLILAHGGSDNWDETVKNATETLKQNYVVEVAFGMANPTTMQEGIDKLESLGVTTIVVVPLFISSYSSIIRQNEYLLGLRDTLADPPMLMMHHGSGSMTIKKEDKHNSMASMTNGTKKIELEPLHFKSKIILTKPLDAHSLVAEIIYDRISELSTNPTNETILIVAHGPNDENDNNNWVNTIDNLADQIRTMQSEKGNKFKQIFGLTVRDDANPAIYEQAKEQLRTLVSQSGKDGEVIVIPLLLSQGGVEARYVKRLEGLNYKWSGKTLLPHPNITKFIQISVENALNMNNEKIVCTETDTINGPLYTIERLKNFMENKEYDNAIALFSEEQQANIQDFRENDEIFLYWCAAWTLDTAKYERYIVKIKDNKAYFVFENGEWKINEK